MNSQPYIHLATHSFQTKPSLLEKCTGAIVSLILLAATLHPASVLAQVVRTPVGTPAWQPTDIHLVVAPIGSAPNFEGVLTSLQAVLPEPNHRFHPDLFIGPGDPHNGPYTSELAGGLATSGFQEKTVFDALDFSGTNGIYLAMMNVPGFGVIPPTQGSSPDFASGPIIPNSLFPICAESFQGGWECRQQEKDRPGNNATGEFFASNCRPLCAPITQPISNHESPNPAIDHSHEYRD